MIERSVNTKDWIRETKIPNPYANNGRIYGTTVSKSRYGHRSCYSRRSDNDSGEWWTCPKSQWQKSTRLLEATALQLWSDKWVMNPNPWRWKPTIVKKTNTLNDNTTLLEMLIDGEVAFGNKPNKLLDKIYRNATKNQRKSWCSYDQRYIRWISNETNVQFEEIPHWKTFVGIILALPSLLETLFNPIL